MTTLKERFGQQFPNNIAEVIDDFGSTTKNDILAFFRQELLALAEEINVMPWKPEFVDEQKEALAKRSLLYVMGLVEAVALIRAKANELADPNQLI